MSIRCHSKGIIVSMVSSEISEKAALENLATDLSRENSFQLKFLTAGQVSDYTGAAALLSSLPPAKALLADKRYDADWFREVLADRNYEACIPSKSNRKIQIPHDRALYRKRHKIENIFGKLKDWRRIHTRYDRCAHTFMSALAIAAIVIFWI